MGLMLLVSVAHADESEEDRKAAAKLFGEGQRAYNQGDFRHAGESFEAAYKHAPRLPPLWNAARAWHKGGELVHAANLYASYLRKAPPTAPDRNSATSAMRDLEGRVARLEVHADGFSDLKVDGVAIDLDDQNARSFVVYVTPGTHVVEGAQAGKVVSEHPTAGAGSAMSVVLVVPTTETVVTPPPPQPLPPPHEPDKPEKRGGWSPIVVVVGGSLTAVAGGFLIWSGLDTVGQRSTFNASPTQANLDTGRSDELRTNVLVGVTAGLGVLTCLAAAFVDWKPKSTHVGFGLGSAFIGGTF
jgi:hypothetical protein